MESKHTKTASFWTDEKHLHFLNTMEASFVSTMLHHYAVVSSQPPLRLDRYLPDTSESTLDSKPNHRRPKKHAYAPPDSMGPTPRGRRTKRRSSHSQSLLQSLWVEQAMAEVENGRELSGPCDVGGDDKEARTNV